MNSALARNEAIRPGLESSWLSSRRPSFLSAFWTSGLRASSTLDSSVPVISGATSLPGLSEKEFGGEKNQGIPSVTSKMVEQTKNN